MLPEEKSQDGSCQFSQEDEEDEHEELREDQKDVTVLPSTLICCTLQRLSKQILITYYFTYCMRQAYVTDFQMEIMQSK